MIDVENSLGMDQISCFDHIVSLGCHHMLVVCSPDYMFYNVTRINGADSTLMHCYI